MRNVARSEQGFVLPISLIFLVVMTLLAITAIRKATMDEKVGGNLRAQEAAFQAAEKALRFCERSIVLATGDKDMCKQRAGATIPIQDPQAADLELMTATDIKDSFPKLWKYKATWVGGGKIATSLTGADVQTGVVEQPSCLIERWPLTGREDRYYPYVITARGVGTTDTAVVYLQEIIRCGNY